jgi:hypothetical protein
MSHYNVGVILPKGNKGKNAKGDVEELLEPFNENKKVPEYERKCYCVGREAATEGSASAEKKLGNVDAFRKSFAEKHPDFAKIDRWTCSNEETIEKVDAAWKKHLAPLKKAEKEATRAHPMFGKPDPKCTDCKGTGKRMTTSNPQSKWDWWVIGGRWAGMWNTKNIEKVSAVAADLDNKGCYAYLTPDGEWHERGQMGWFGMASNEEPKKKWDEKVRKLLARHKDCVMVLVDCHT